MALLCSWRRRRRILVARPESDGAVRIARDHNLEFENDGGIGINRKASLNAS